MDQIILKQDGVLVQTEIEVMGATEPYEKEMSYEELNQNYDLDLRVDRVEPDSDGNGEFMIRLQLDTGQHQAQSNQPQEFEDVPPVPGVPRDDIPDQRRPFYDRLKDPKMQPFDIRRLIYEEGELTERKLKELLHERGHRNVEPGKQHGGVAMTLVVLDEVTEEIERHGRGEEKTIEWVGAE